MKLSDVAVPLSVLLTLCGMVAMGSFLFVVTHHPVLQADEFKASVTYTSWCVVGYAIFSVVYTKIVRGKEILLLWRFVGLPRFGSRFKRSFCVGGAIGCLWATNYVCALVAGPYIPNALQTIFAQVQLLVTYCVNFGLFKNPLSTGQHLVIGLFIGIQIGSGVFVSGTGLFTIPGLSTGWTAIWSLVFMCQAVGSGLATNFVEALMEIARNHPDNPKFSPTGSVEPTTSEAAKSVSLKNANSEHGSETVELLAYDAPDEDSEMHFGYNKLDFILAVNMVSAMWSLLFEFVPLFGVACLSYKGNVLQQVFVDWSAFTSGSGQAFVFTLAVSSWIFIASSYYALAHLDALFVAVVTAIANIVQIAVFNSESLVTSTYYSPVNTPQWEVNASIAVLCIAYAISPWLVSRGYFGPVENVDKNERVRTSIIGRFYERNLSLAFD